MTTGFKCGCCKSHFPKVEAKVDMCLNDFVCTDCAKQLMAADAWLRHCDLPICTHEHHNRLEGLAGV